MADPKSNLLRGRPFGTPKPKRNQEGEEIARDVLVQSDDDLVEVTDPEKGALIVDRHPRAVSDPVMRRLREQARCGVGTQPGQLPPAVFTALADRAFGKVVEKVKQVGGRPYAGDSEDQLKERLEKLQSALVKPRTIREA